MPFPTVASRVAEPCHLRSLLVISSFAVGLALLGACSDDVGSSPGTERSDVGFDFKERDGFDFADDEPFDLAECNYFTPEGVDPWPNAFISVRDAEDLDVFPRVDEFCFEGKISINDDDDGDIHDVEALQKMQYAYSIEFGGVVLNYCEASDPDVDYCRGNWATSVNENLATLRGLRSLRRVGLLIIYAGGGFENLDGLQRLRQVDHILEIGSESMNMEVGPVPVKTLNGLNNLRRAGELYLGGRSNLESLNGLEGLRVIGGDLVIRDHRHLEDVSALHHVERVEGEVIIVGNRLLSPCRVDRLIEAIGRENIGGEIRLSSGWGLDGDDGC